jgi:hypothetical protein
MLGTVTSPCKKMKVQIRNVLELRAVGLQTVRLKMLTRDQLTS